MKYVLKLLKNHIFNRYAYKAKSRKHSETLYEVEIPVADIDDCVKEYKDANENTRDKNLVEVTHDHICVGKEGKDACFVSCSDHFEFNCILYNL